MWETFEHVSKELSIGAVHVFNLDLTACLRLIIQIFCNLSIRYHGIFLHSVMDNFGNVRLTGTGNLKHTMEQEKTVAKNHTFNVFRQPGRANLQ